MVAQFENIRHDGGTHRVEIETEGGQCVIRFGASFTLRVDAQELDKLREMLHTASVDLMLDVEPTDLTGRTFSISEDDFISEGIKAREEVKESKRSPQQDIDMWAPNDPVNW